MPPGRRDYLLDTNALSALAAVRGGSTAPRYVRVSDKFNELKRDGKSRFFTSVISVGELEYGLLTAPTPDVTAQRLVRQIVEAFPGKMILAIEKGDARFHYAKLRAKLFELYAPRDAKGRAKTNYVTEWVDPTTDSKLGVNENDVWIASLALAHNLTLVTADKMVHIRKAAGVALNYENWEE